MKLNAETARKLIRLELPRCLLILTGEEYARAILRGKMERRRESNEKRTRGAGNILEAIDDGRSKMLNPARPGKSPEGQKF